MKLTAYTLKFLHGVVIGIKKKHRGNFTFTFILSLTNYFTNSCFKTGLHEKSVLKPQLLFPSSW